MKERQLEIIEAAGRILTASGVKGLTIKNLAKEMRFSESAIYRHFDSKEKIIIALLNFLAENMDERLAKAIRPDDTPEEKLKKLFQSQFVYFKEHPHFVVAVFSDGLMEESEKINLAIFRIMSVLKKHLLPIIVEGQQKGVFTEAVTTKHLVHIIMGTFRLQKFVWKVNNFKFDLEEDGNNRLQSLLILIKNR